MTCGAGGPQQELGASVLGVPCLEGVTSSLDRVPGWLCPRTVQVEWVLPGRRAVGSGMSSLRGAAHTPRTQTEGEGREGRGDPVWAPGWVWGLRRREGGSHRHAHLVLGTWLAWRLR